jgi:hypothetical protein
MMKRRQVRTNVAQLLVHVRSLLPETDANNAADLLKHDEWGEAFTLICTQLYEYDLSISQDVFELIEKTGKSMKLSPDVWVSLRIEP